MVLPSGVRVWLAVWLMVLPSGVRVWLAVWLVVLPSGVRAVTGFVLLPAMVFAAWVAAGVVAAGFAWVAFTVSSC